MVTTYTIDEILAMNATTAEATYRTLRTELHEDYQSVGPRATRHAMHEIDKRRAAGGRHVETAKRLEIALGEERAEYDLAAHCKTLLAIWTGRYDDGLWQSRGPCLSSDPNDQADYDRVCTARRAAAGITQDPSRQMREAAESAIRTAARLRQRGRTPSRVRVVELMAAHGGDTHVAADAGDYDRYLFADRARTYGLVSA
jgi:hypothetical protein